MHYSGLTDIKYTDFEPICLVSATPSVPTASPKTPWKNWQEFLADAKKRPGEITVGATLSSTSHIFPATIEKAAGIKFKYVSYEGLAPRMNAILGGHIHLTAPTSRKRARWMRGTEVPCHRHRAARPGDTRRADAEGAGLQHRL